ncbi:MULTISPECIES: sigma-70 family RNA polymerase sigma factor [unclassified Microcoleus]|uniref:sigma-70 family RNA polymerase sigma factor n=1 Tax=unclassified Microcoleus TaxID=2642155 RepID=UPI002FD3C8F7
MTDKSNPSEGEDHLSDESDAVGCSVKSEKFDRDPAHQQIVELVTKACQHPPGSPQRGRFLHRLILEILKSGKLWKEHTPYYKEALNKTWIYLSRNLCEATTAKRPYDPEESLITTWLNPYLQKRLLDCRLAEQKAKQNITDRRLVSLDDEDDDGLKPSEKIPATPDLTFYMEEILEWIETDPTGVLKSNHLPRRPDITCQVLLQRKWSSGQSMEQLAAELNCAPCTLYKLLKLQCLPLLQKFCEDQGYQLILPGVTQK